jgi:hypothetical protein
MSPQLIEIQPTILISNAARSHIQHVFFSPRKFPLVGAAGLLAQHILCSTSERGCGEPSDAFSPFNRDIQQERGKVPLTARNMQISPSLLLR